jgi:diaminopimelate epimerase
MHFSKAHAYGNDFLYVREQDAAAGTALDALARELCDRHTGIGADGLILYDPAPEGASMRLLNADGSWSEVSGNGVRGLAALLLRDDPRENASITITTAGGVKTLVRTGREGSRQTFRAAMGLPADLREVTVTAAGESVRLAVMNFGNPQCVALGALPDEARFHRLGPALGITRSFRPAPTWNLRRSRRPTPCGS